MTAAPVRSTPGTPPAWLPPAPEGFADTGLAREFVVDLLLKTLYVQGARAGQGLTDAIKLPFRFLDDCLLDLQQRRLVEVRGTQGPNRAAYVFDLTGAGRDRAREALAASQYVGPAPVPLEQYRHSVAQQSIARVHVTYDSIRRGFKDLVLDEGTIELLGPAINSAKSLFLFGESGNGKTAIAEAIAGLLGGAFHVPYAVEVGGEIIVLHDPVYHHAEPDRSRAAEGASLWLHDGPGHDQRYTLVQRPVVLAGGELTLDQLDLQYDGFTKVYQAPFQVKANGGVLIIDDFGRQRVPPRDLLNRWIVPLERRVDFLTLHTGAKFPVPFDCLVIFATNLDPTALVEEAFLRRIHYKVQVENPTVPHYEEIFRRCCATRGIPFDPGAISFIYREYYDRLQIEPRSCHPRDLTDHVRDIAKFLEVEPALSDELLERACHSYFLDTAHRDLTVLRGRAAAPLGKELS